MANLNSLLVTGSSRFVNVPIASGYEKYGSSDSYVLLGGGGHYLKSTDNTANSIVVRDGSGHIRASYYNASCGNDSSIMDGNSYVIFANSDGWFRKGTIAQLKSLFGLGSNAYTSTTYLPVAGGTMTGGITFNGVESGNSYGLYWYGSTDAIDMYYSVLSADEGALVINMRDDSNVKTCFAYNGTIQSYIDTNGTYNGFSTRSYAARQLEAFVGDDFSSGGHFVKAIRFNGWQTRLYMCYDSGPLQANSVYVYYADVAGFPAGFYGKRDDATWGNQAGSFVTDWYTSNGAEIQFRDNGGQLNVNIDGFLCQNEGRYLVLDTNNWSSYITTATFASSGHSHGLAHSEFIGYIGDGSDSTFAGNGIPNGNAFVMRSFRSQSTAPAWFLGNYAAGIAFGGYDTKGILSCAYDSGYVRFAGGAGTSPAWYFTLYGDSGWTYNLTTLANNVHNHWGGATGTDGEGTVWNDFKIKEYDGAYPDGSPKKMYGWGGVVSFGANNFRLDLYATHASTSDASSWCYNGLQYRSGWADDRKAWRILLDDVNYASYMEDFSWSSSLVYCHKNRSVSTSKNNDSWDSHFFSNYGYDSDCSLSFKAASTSGYKMIGLNVDPGASASYDTLDYCWYLQNDGGLCIYESGTAITSGVPSSYTTYDEFRIDYVNGRIIYYKNGVRIRYVARSGSGKLHMDSSWYNNGAIYDIEFKALPITSSTAYKVFMTSHPDTWYLETDWDGSYFQTRARYENGTLPINVARSDASGYASSSDTCRRSLQTGDDSIVLYAHHANEINFGGTNESQVIYFGYRGMDSRPAPVQYVFGGGSGGYASIWASGVKFPGVNSYAYVLTTDGGYKQWSTDSSANTIVSRDENCYIRASYYNASCGNDSSIMDGNSYVIFANSDGWFRKATPARALACMDGMALLHDGSYYGMATPWRDATAWIRTTQSGLIPYVAGEAGNGHSYLGTSGWYFANAYIDNIYGTLHGNASSASSAPKISADASIWFGNSGLQYTDCNGPTGTSATAVNNPTADWYHHIIMNHPNGNGYWVDIALCFHSDNLWYRRVVYGGSSGWTRVVDSSNIGWYINDVYWSGSVSCPARTTTTINLSYQIESNKFRIARIYWTTSSASGVSDIRGDSFNILHNVMTASGAAESNIIQFKIISGGTQLTVGPGTTGITVIGVVLCNRI